MLIPAKSLVSSVKKNRTVSFQFTFDFTEAIKSSLSVTYFAMGVQSLENNRLGGHSSRTFSDNLTTVAPV
jgi:hypothetical protein